LRLGLRGLARAGAGVAGTCVAFLAAFVLATVVSGIGATAVGGPSAWAVTVGAASRTLLPGTDATMPYEVRNATSSIQRLHGTSVAIRPEVDACPAVWFRSPANDVVNDVDVAPGATVRGTLIVAFDDAASAQDACQDTGVQVVVTAS